MLKGTVTVFWELKHFGFIRQSGSINEIFFHELNVSADSPLPKKYDRVTYEEGEFNGRKCAVNVAVVKPSGNGGGL